MHGNLSAAERRAIKASGRSATETLPPVVVAVVETSSDISDRDDSEWFQQMAQALLSKPGLELNLLTGFDESLCYRYAKGAVKPPGYFLRKLLRGPRGNAFYRVLMDGCTESWWVEQQADARLAALARKLIAELSQ